MVRDDERVGAGRDRLPRVFTGVHAFDDDRAFPQVADPPQVGPRHHRLRERRADVGVAHRPFRQHHIRKVHQPAVGQKTGQPPRTRQHLPNERQLFPEASADQLFHAVADIPFALSRYGRVDGDDQCREARGLRSGDAGGGDVAAADQIHLIPRRPAGRGFHLFEPAPGQRRQDVGRPGGAGRFRGHDFAAGIEQAAAADRREQERQVERRAEHRCAQIGALGGHGAARAKGDRLERAAVLAQRDFIVRAAVDVVERQAGQAALGEPPEVGDVDHSRGGYTSRHVL